ncbi:hypothetical protein LXL04_001753 [Taraxacum kok-saghyz]
MSRTDLINWIEDRMQGVKQKKYKTRNISDYTERARAQGLRGRAVGSNESSLIAKSETDVSTFLFPVFRGSQSKHPTGSRPCCLRAVPLEVTSVTTSITGPVGTCVDDRGWSYWGLPAVTGSVPFLLAFCAGKFSAGAGVVKVALVAPGEVSLVLFRWCHGVDGYSSIGSTGVLPLGWCLRGYLPNVVPCLTAWSVMRMATLLTLSYVNGLKAVTEFWIWEDRPQMYLSIFLDTGVTIPGHGTDRSLKRTRTVLLDHHCFQLPPGQGVGFYNAYSLYVSVPPGESRIHERTGRELDLAVGCAVTDLEDGFRLLKPACQFYDTCGSSELVGFAIYEILATKADVTLSAIMASMATGSKTGGVAPVPSLASLRHCFLDPFILGCFSRQSSTRHQVLRTVDTLKCLNGTAFSKKSQGIASNRKPNDIIYSINVKMKKSLIFYTFLVFLIIGTGKKLTMAQQHDLLQIAVKQLQEAEKPPPHLFSQPILRTEFSPKPH